MSTDIKPPQTTGQLKARVAELEAEVARLRSGLEKIEKMFSRFYVGSLARTALAAPPKPDLATFLESLPRSDLKLSEKDIAEMARGTAAPDAPKWHCDAPIAGMAGHFCAQPRGHADECGVYVTVRKPAPKEIDDTPPGHLFRDAQGRMARCSPACEQCEKLRAWGGKHLRPDEPAPKPSVEEIVAKEARRRVHFDLMAFGTATAPKPKRPGILGACADCQHLLHADAGPRCKATDRDGAWFCDCEQDHRKSAPPGWLSPEARAEVVKLITDNWTCDCVGSVCPKYQALALLDGEKEGA